MSRAAGAGGPLMTDLEKCEEEEPQGVGTGDRPESNQTGLACFPRLDLQR